MVWAFWIPQLTFAAGCGNLSTSYGPFDYRTDRDKLPIVDRSHFMPEIEASIGDEWTIAGNLSYTLTAFPNHHRALNALVRFGEKLKSEQPPHLPYSIECYFDRALRFRSDDTVVRGLYARYLGRHGRIADADRQLEKASQDAKENGFSQYNIGLVYFELKEYDKALAQAHKAVAAGFERVELREMLKREKRWRDPPPEAPGTVATDAESSQDAALPASQSSYAPPSQ